MIGNSRPNSEEKSGRPLFFFRGMPEVGFFVFFEVVDIGTRLFYVDRYINYTGYNVLQVAYRGYYYCHVHNPSYSDSDGSPSQTGLETDAAVSHNPITPRQS
jgi:hypothetical protein